MPSSRFRMPGLIDPEELYRTPKFAPEGMGDFSTYDTEGAPPAAAAPIPSMPSPAAPTHSSTNMLRGARDRAESADRDYSNYISGPDYARDIAPPKTSITRRILAGALGGAAGYVNSGGRVHINDDLVERGEQGILYGNAPARRHSAETKRQALSGLASQERNALATAQQGQYYEDQDQNRDQDREIRRLDNETRALDLAERRAQTGARNAETFNRDQMSHGGGMVRKSDAYTTPDFSMGAVPSLPPTLKPDYAGYEPVRQQTPNAQGGFSEEEFLRQPANTQEVSEEDQKLLGLPRFAAATVYNKKIGDHRLVEWNKQKQANVDAETEFKKSLQPLKDELTRSIINRNNRYQPGQGRQADPEAFQLKVINGRNAINNHYDQRENEILKTISGSFDAEVKKQANDRLNELKTNRTTELDRFDKAVSQPAPRSGIPEVPGGGSRATPPPSRIHVTLGQDGKLKRD